ncbi:helix-turn-helix domain-containing protein [Gimesia fumaroli]|uniref:Uncharacterized protein n=1 Tax=Gimesia fumaroli TaxID=2527976 RepID=A0A518IKX0_9PLAN|nr:helix-turn-helix domain-containing protein [Gimesia fumaroli]QDV53733.1 hypothetical protein Enr17x_58140 [Gimesia fumaroli]
MATNTTEQLTGADEDYGYLFGCDGLLSLKQAAKKLGVHVNSIRRFCEDGRLRGGKLPVAEGEDNSKGKRVVCTRSVRNLIERAQD